jgi:hypothetical protein
LVYEKNANFVSEKCQKLPKNGKNSRKCTCKNRRKWQKSPKIAKIAKKWQKSPKEGKNCRNMATIAEKGKNRQSLQKCPKIMKITSTAGHSVAVRTHHFLQLNKVDPVAFEIRHDFSRIRSRMQQGPI